MYAVIETGGKQYRVEVGTELEVELPQEGVDELLARPRLGGPGVHLLRDLVLRLGRHVVSLAHWCPTLKS